MEQLERRQDERDERRRAEGIKSQAVSFIAKYHSDRGLIPLCAMAAMHDNLFDYSRDMYREYCCLTAEVQNRILEYCRLDLRVKTIDNLFGGCIKVLESIIKERFPHDDSPFYDNGKYVLRSLTCYGKERIPITQIQYHPIWHSKFAQSLCTNKDNDLWPYEECITDVLNDAFRGQGSQTPIRNLEGVYGFGAKLNGIESCQFVTTLAQYIAVYAKQEDESSDDHDINYGSPGGYDGETIDSMEDLFLLALFYIYTRLILK